MVKRWSTVFLFSVLLLAAILWAGAKEGHKRHELFAVKVKDAGGWEEEIECWQNPYSEKYYVFLPAYEKESGYRVCLNEGEELFVGNETIEGDEPLQDISFGEEYPFMLVREDGSKTEGRLTFMKSANLAALYIDTESGSLEAVHRDKEHKESGSYSLVAADGRKEAEGLLEYITGRGNGTWENAKKPYTMKLRHKQDFFGMGEADKWILLANYNDASSIRNKIMFELGKEIGLKYSPDSEFVDLYVNGYYTGLYQLTEKVEVGENRVDISDLDRRNKEVNAENIEPEYFEKENAKGVAWPNQPEDITGGYLLELEMNIRFGQEASGFFTDQGQAVMISSPREASEGEVNYIRNLVQEFEDALYAENGVNPDTGKSFGDYIDMESWAKKYLLEEVSKNMDSGISSSYFYKESDREGDGLFYAGPVWDYDFSMGSGDWSVRKPEGLLANRDMRTSDKEIYENLFRNRWFAQLYTQEVFLDEVKKQYRECVRPAVREVLDIRIEEYEKWISEAFQMNMARWYGEPIPLYCAYRDNLEEAVDYIEDFLDKRLKFLDEVWIEEADYCTVTCWTDYGSRIFYFSVKRNDFLEKTPGYADSYGGMVFDGWYYDEAYTQPFDSRRPITEDTDIYAKWIPQKNEGEAGYESYMEEE